MVEDSSRDELDDFVMMKGLFDIWLLKNVIIMVCFCRDFGKSFIVFKSKILVLFLVVVGLKFVRV